MKRILSLCGLVLLATPILLTLAQAGDTVGPAAQLTMEGAEKTDWSGLKGGEVHTTRILDEIDLEDGHRCVDGIKLHYKGSTTRSIDMQLAFLDEDKRIADKGRTYGPRKNLFPIAPYDLMYGADMHLWKDKGADFEDVRFFTRAIQVCTEEDQGSQNEIRGVRMWASRVGQKGKVVPKDESIEVKLDGCDKWKDKVACPEGMVAWDVEARGEKDRYRALRLVCGTPVGGGLSGAKATDGPIDPGGKGKK